jgi:hypothetical protein
MQSIKPAYCTMFALMTAALSAGATALGEEQRSRVFHAFSETGEGIGCVAFSPDGRRALTGSRDGKLRLWDVDSGSLLRTLVGHTEYVRAIAFLPDGQGAISGSLDNTLRQWDLESGKEVRRFALGVNSSSSSLDRRLVTVAVSGDGLRALCGDPRTLGLFDLPSAKQVRSIEPKVGLIEGAAISPDGRRGLAGGSNESVVEVDLETGSLRRLGWHGDYVRCVVFSPDGTIAASGARDKEVFLWDLQSGQKVRTLSAHTSWVESLAFSPDGARLVSGSRDTTVRLWDVKTGEHQLLKGDEHHVLAVSFSADGRRILSGTGRGITYGDIGAQDQVAAGP